LTIIGKIPEGYPPANLFGGLNLVDLPPLVNAASVKDYARHPANAFLRLCNGDGNHSGIQDNYKSSVFSPIVGGPSAPMYLGALTTLRGGMLFGENVPANARGFLVICETSYGGTPTIGILSNPTLTASVKAAWTDPVTPVLNILPMALNFDRAKPPSVTPYAMSVDGLSNSTAPYQAHAACCVSMFRESVRPQLKAQGKLCDTIVQCLKSGLAAIGMKMIGDIFPTLERLTAEQHIAYFRAYAPVANAIGGDVVVPPVPVPVPEPVPAKTPFELLQDSDSSLSDIDKELGDKVLKIIKAVAK